MYDYSKLLGTLKEKGITQMQLAAAMRKNVATINAKLNGYSYFTQNEIAQICEILELSHESIPTYFFTHKLRKIL